MSTYPEIKPADIKAGDTIRAEEPANPRLTAVEYIAQGDGEVWRAALDSLERTHYLISRPTPPIELPKTRTLGWLSWRDDLAICDTTELGMWRSTGGATVTDKDTGVPVKMLTAFAPATAVPTDALDELRRVVDNHRGSITATAEASRAFLAAVTAVEEATS